MNRTVEKIELARLKRDITQGELERRAGLPNSRVSKWVAGSGEPTARQAARIALVLGIDLEWLCDEEALAEDWNRKRGLTPLESHHLYLSNRLGLNKAAKLVADALLAENFGGGPGETGPPIVTEVQAGEGENGSKGKAKGKKGPRKRTPKPKPKPKPGGGSMAGPGEIAPGRAAPRL